MSENFDTAFYQKHYASLIGDDDPALHYESRGRSDGLMPNAEFDPLVAAIRFPDLAEVDAANNISEKGLEHHMKELAREVFRHVQHADAFDWRFGDTQLEKDHAKRPTGTLAHWDEVDTEEEVLFSAHGKSYAIRKRSCDHWISQIESGTPLVFPRLPHGFIDMSGRKSVIEPIIQSLWGEVLDSGEKIERFAIRLLKVLYRKSPILTENFFMEVRKILRDGGATLPIGLAFKAHPDHPDRLFGTAEPSAVRFNAATKFISDIYPDGFVFEDGLAWKRYVSTGRISKFIDALRDRKIVLIANAGFAKLGERWQLSDFHHIEIPPANSHLVRFDLLDQLSGQLADLGVGQEDKDPAIVLTQAGGSFSLWLLDHLSLRMPHATYMDLGQAINVWFLDDGPTGKPEMLWLQDFWEQIFETNELYPFYDDLLGMQDSRDHFRSTVFTGELVQKLPKHGGNFDFAWRMMHIGLPEKALVFAERAHAHAPDSVPPIVLLVRLYKYFKRFEEARIICEKGLSLDPFHETLRDLRDALPAGS